MVEGWTIYTLLMVIVFIVGYFFITVEHTTKLNKTGVALLMAMICWILQFVSQKDAAYDVQHLLYEHLSSVSQVIFFLLGALTIVEIINSHRGFRIISDSITVTSKRKMLWLVGFISFFLSSILDNLTTTIIMVALIQKLIANQRDRLIIGGAVVIAANAGGAWTPIGDVTTTMLWIGGELSTLAVMKDLFIPSLACLIGSLLCLTPFLKGEFPRSEIREIAHVEPRGQLMFFLGVGSLIFVPIFKILTGLPPFMGVIFGLSIMWIVTDLIHSRYPERDHLKVPYIMSRIDLSGTLFFLGILLCIASLDAAGLLSQLANWMNQKISDPTYIAVSIGLASAVVDNVPLVAATMSMYDLTQYPMDHSFWELIAYCAGTGGSILIVGSAAGVAFMGMEKVDFFWYFRKIGLAALVGYCFGIAFYILV